MTISARHTCQVCSCGQNWVMMLTPAMASTAAVETEIDRHYEQQRQALAGHDDELEGAIAQFQSDELAHRDHALAAGAERAVGYPLLSAGIRAICRIAIRLSERI